MLSIYKSFGRFQALKNINFDLNAGETIAIVGESGSGKSTTAKVLLRLEAADSGQVLYQGQNILALSEQELLSKRRDIQMVFQDPSQSLNPRMTVFELISEAWIIHPDILDKSEWPARVAKLLKQVGLSEEHNERYPHQFSGGQRQRIAIARALALEPKIIICDEAVSALDVSVQAQVISLLKKLKKDLGLSYIFIAHDLPVVRDFADRVIVMKDGQIVETGLIKDIFANPKQTYTQDLLSASLEADPDLQAKRREQRKKL
jgi:peptide/nickel transport system ATP-binding protein